MANINFNWFDPVPNGFVKKQPGQWPDISPNMTLKPGHVYINEPPTAPQKIANTFVKGVTHFRKSRLSQEPTLPQDKMSAGEPRIRDALGITPVNGHYLAPNFSESYVRAKAHQYEGCKVIVGEFMEGEEWVDQSNIQWSWFWNECKLMGIPFRAHNYFGVYDNDGYSFKDNIADNMFIYDLPLNQWKPNVYFDNLKDTNLILQGAYFNTPDTHGEMYTILFKIEWARKMGFMSGVFLQGVREFAPFYGWKIPTTAPAGTMMRSTKVPVEPGLAQACGFVSDRMGGVTMSWGIFGPASGNPNDLRPTFTAGYDHFYDQNGNAANFPYTNADPGWPSYPTAGYDNFHFGVGLSEKIRATENAVENYADFALDGNPYITKQANGSDILYANRDKRGICKVAVTGNVASVWYINPGATDNNERILHVKNPLNPSQIFTAPVAGHGIHTALFNI